MYIEDLIILAATRIQMNPFDSKLIYSFQDQIFRGSGLTEKQSNVALKILKRQQPKLNLLIGQDISVFLDNPSYRLTKRVVNLNKLLSVINHEVYGKAIKAEFPYNEQIIQLIREVRSSLNFAQWDKEEKSWIFSLDEKNLKLLRKIHEQHNFSASEEIENYFSQIKEIESNIEKYIPMVSYEGASIVFKNISAFTPQIKTTDVLYALFEARKLGIHTWDEKINEEFNSLNCENSVREFLNTPPNQNFEFFLENQSFNDISNIVKYLTPCIFIIPGGSELSKLELSIELLKNIGIENTQTSVLFRLPNETGEKFNNFVKSNGLNNPVSDQTKAIFISSKIPKTIIDPRIKFNSVINFNFYSIHYTIREFLKNHHNVIHVMDKKPQRNINFAFM